MFVVLYKDKAGLLQKIESKRRQNAIKAIQVLYDNQGVTEVSVINGKAFSVNKIVSTTVSLIPVEDGDEEEESPEAEPVAEDSGSSH